MLFSSPIFLYLFLPLVLLIVFLVRQDLRNYVLLVASWIFFAWGGVSFFLILLASTLLNYLSGLIIGTRKSRNSARWWLVLCVVLNIGGLVVFKYANFIVDNVNVVFGWVGAAPVEVQRIALPIGISFFTFQAMSYVIDLYRKEVKMQKNFFDLALYVALFPQLIAGPIVRYQTVEEELANRITSFPKFASGVKRFIIGLAKKILIANPMAFAADTTFGTDDASLTSPMAWFGIVCYAFQIYYDFSGYSDMAIGLGKMFGFHFLENFDFPYISRSIKELWRRWHISLSTWFRDYVYIPLGGNKIGTTRTYVNLLIVFFVTGFWHGASWNFLVWGMIHGLFLVLERLGLEKLLLKLWRPLQHFYTLFIILIAWVFFRAEDLDSSLTYLGIMFGMGTSPYAWQGILEFFTPDFIIVFVFAVLGSTKIFEILIKKVNAIITGFNGFKKEFAIHAYSIATIAFVAFVLFMSTVMLIAESYNPFIYFRF